MKVKVVSFNLVPGAAGTKASVTGVGFKPQAIIFFSTGNNGSITVVGRGNQFSSIGIATDSPVPDGHGAEAACADNVDPTNAGSFIVNRHTLTAWVQGMPGGGNCEFNIASMDPDGFTYIVVAQIDANADARVFALCIAGVNQVKTGRFQVAGSTGNQSIAVGFKPDIVFYIASMGTNAPPVTAGGARFVIGVARDATHQGLVCTMGARASGTNARRRYAITTECAGTLDDVSNAMTDRATFVSMDDNGFTHNWLERATTKHIHFLAIQGGSWFVGNFLSRTNTTPFQVATPFKPRGLFFLSHGAAEDVADTVRTQSKLSIGAASFDPLARGACAYFDLDGVNPTQVTRGMRINDAVYERIADAGSTDEGLMDVLSADDTPGFTAVMTDADPDAALVTFVAMGLGSTPGKTPASISSPVTLLTPTPTLNAAGPLYLDP